MRGLSPPHLWRKLHLAGTVPVRKKNTPLIRPSAACLHEQCFICSIPHTSLHLLTPRGQRLVAGTMYVEEIPLLRSRNRCGRSVKTGQGQGGMLAADPMSQQPAIRSPEALQQDGENQAPTDWCVVQQTSQRPMKAL